MQVRTQKLGGVAVLCLQGRIINGETDVLSAAIRSQSNASAIVLDFAQVELIDAKGLGVLIELREFTQTQGIEFRLININRLVQQVLDVTRLHSLFDKSLDLEVPAASRFYALSRRVAKWKFWTVFRDPLDIISSVIK
jgi:anti-sigma B factor antagonist